MYYYSLDAQVKWTNEHAIKSFCEMNQTSFSVHNVV